MKDSKFLRLFNKLTEEERLLFNRFVQVLYEGKHKQLELLKYVYDMGKAEKNTFNSKAAYFYVFGRESVTKKDDKNLSNLFSDLTKWLEAFLLCRQNEKFSFYKNSLIQEIYQKRDLPDDYITFIKRSKLQNTKRLQKSEFKPLYNYINNQLLYFTSHLDKHSLPNQYLLEGWASLEEFYLIAKLKLLTELKNRGEVLNEAQQSQFIKEASFGNDLIGNNDLIEIYRLRYHLLIKPSDAIYESFKELILKVENLDKSLHLSFLLSAINYTATKSRNGDSSFFEEAFILYEHGINKKILLVNGSISEMSFKNIVNLACKLDRCDWAETFVQNWQCYIYQESREDLVNLCLARIYFEKRKYEELIQIILTTVLQNDLYKLEIRLLEIRAHYELGDFARTIELCNNLKNFVNGKKKLNKEHVTGTLNFLKFTKKLASRKRKHSLLEDIENTEVVFYKEWLIEKFDMLPN